MGGWYKILATDESALKKGATAVASNKIDQRIGLVGRFSESGAGRSALADQEDAYENDANPRQQSAGQFLAKKRPKRFDKNSR